MAQGLSSPIFLKYLEIYEKNPRSRVFAPLAEHYRQVGMLEKAIEVLKKGIKAHPSYSMGHLGLAFCYYDQRQFEHSYNTLKPFFTTNRDNIRLQRLYAKSCLEIGKFEEALDVLKYILFVNPRDLEAAEYIKHLEKGELARVVKAHDPIPFEEEEQRSPSPDELLRTFQLENMKVDPSQDHVVDSWRRVDLTKMTKAAVSKTEEVRPPSDIEMFKPETAQEFLKKNFEFNFAMPTSSPRKKNEDEAPFMTHTLVDLYCSQGHVAKAIEILEKMLEINQTDEKTLKKLQEVTSIYHSSKELGYSKTELESEKLKVRSLFEKQVTEEQVDERQYAMPQHQVEPEESLNAENLNKEEIHVEQKHDEEIGRQQLMNLLEKKLKNNVNVYLNKVELRMNTFLTAVQKRHQEYRKGC